MLAYNEIKEKKIIIYNGEPCEVIESHVARTQQRKPQNQVKLKSLISGKTIAATFHVSDKAEEAEIGKTEIKFLYHNRGEFWFGDPNNPHDRFKIEESLIGDAAKFLKPNVIVSALTFSASGGDEDIKIIKIALPVKMQFVVKEAPPSIKGDTAGGGGKVVVLENGTAINAPLFINSGETIVVNTDTGEYVERA
jgi:elongation factor P